MFAKLGDFGDILKKYEAELLVYYRRIYCKLMVKFAVYMQR